MKINTPFRIAGLANFIGLFLLAGVTSSLAVNSYSKADNTIDLNQSASWFIGVVPTSADTGQWDAAVTSANTTVLGANLNWAGMVITTPGGLITINSGNTLTLGTAGIDMSTASQNLTLNCGLTLGGAQTWTINSGRTLTVGGASLAAGANLLNVAGAGNGIIANSAGISSSVGLVKTGSGTLIIMGGANQHSVGVGTFTVNGGFVNLNNPATVGISNMLAGTANLSLGGGALQYQYAVSLPQSFNNLTINPGESALVLSRNGAFNTSLTVAGAVTRSMGGTVYSKPYDASRGATIYSRLTPSTIVKSSAGTPYLTTGTTYSSPTTDVFNDWGALNGANQVVVATYTATTASSLGTAAQNANVAVATTTLAANATATSFRDNVNQATTIELNGKIWETGGILVGNAKTTAGSIIKDTPGMGGLKGPGGSDLVFIVDASLTTPVPFTVRASILDNPGQAVIDFNSTRQRIDGFGGSTAWDGSQWTADKADLFFSTNNGCGLSLLRTRIAPDGSTVEGTTAGLAQARGARVWSAPWSPPPTYKDTNSVNGGNFVSTAANLQAYANQLAKYVAMMKNTYGVNLYALSVQNEPNENTTIYESCVWSGQQIHDFLPYLSASLIASNAAATKIMIAESLDWKFGLATNSMNDTTTSNLVDILAAHNYGSSAPPVTQFGTPCPKTLWETEHYFGSGDDITNALAVVQEIHSFLTVNEVNAYHYWWLNGSGNGSLAGDSTSPPAKRLYAMGNYSRFVRPDFYRVSVTNNTAALITAFKDPGSSNFVIVAANPTASPVIQRFSLMNFSALTNLTPWVTSATQSLASTTGFSVTNGVFNYILPAWSVVSFVTLGSTGGNGTTNADLVFNATAITKGAPGTLILSGNNAFTGGVHINDGTIQLGSVGALNANKPNAINFNGSGITANVQNTGLGRLASAPTLALAGNSVTVAAISTANNQSGVLPVIQNANGSPVAAATLTDAESGTNTFAGTLKDGPGGGALALTKTGSGRLILSGPNTYTGNTSISSGALALAGAGSIANSANINISADALFDVSGTSGGALTLTGGQSISGVGSVKGNFILGSGAQLSPGNNGIGVLTFSDALTLAAGGTNYFEIFKSPLTNDVARVMGTLTEGGTLSVTNLGGALASGDSFNLFNAANYSGAFTGFVLPPLTGNLAWNTSRLNADGSLWVVSTFPPVISQVGLSEAGLISSGTGGTPGWNYYVLTTTNLVLPTAQWTRAATNSFDANGDFIFTNVVNPTSVQQFYRLQTP